MVTPPPATTSTHSTTDPENVRDDFTERSHFSWRRVPFAVCLAISLPITIIAFVVGSRQKYVIDSCDCNDGRCQEDFCYCSPIPGNNDDSNSSSSICVPEHSDSVTVRRFQAPARPVAYTFLVFCIVMVFCICLVQMIEISTAKQREARTATVDSDSAAITTRDKTERNNHNDDSDPVFTV